jgi:hypothetical protein
VNAVVQRRRAIGVLLPRGVTGIESRKEGPPSCADFQSFREHCYLAAREAGWSLRELRAPRQSIACNYALAVLAFRESAIAATLNGVFPLLAFATPPAEGQVELDFVDCPELGAAFERLGYTVMPAAGLARPLTQELWQGLASNEQNQVRYFRPRRVGDVIYNLWD